MGKKKGLGILGLAAAAGAAAAVVKYLRDYTDFKTAAEGSIHELEGSAEDVKRAAKRTYTSISCGNTGEIKEAASELAKAAGNAAKDAGSIAKAAGQSAAAYVKDMKAKYDEDPEAAKSEVVGNLKNMASDASQTAGSVSAKVGEKLKPENLKAGAGDIKDKVTEAVSGLREKYQKSFENIGDDADDLCGAAESAAEEGEEAIEEKAKELAEAVSEEAEVIGEAAEAAAEAFAAAKEEAKTAAEPLADESVSISEEKAD